MVVKTLNCTKKDETLNISYVNEKINNFQYLIKGNYEEEKNAEELDLELQGDTKEKEENNTLITNIRDYANVTYDAVNDITEFRINLASVETIPEVLSYAKEIEGASSYYSNNGFSCTTQSY